MRSVIQFSLALGLISGVFGYSPSAGAQTSCCPANTSGAPCSAHPLYPKLTADARQGIAGSQVILGAYFYNGKDVPKDYTVAACWWRRAAEQGYRSGQYLIGDMYMRGHGVPKDFVLAYKWFNLATAGGDKDAEELRDYLESEMTPAQIAEAQKLAREWRKKEE